MTKQGVGVRPCWALASRLPSPDVELKRSRVEATGKRRWPVACGLGEAAFQVPGLAGRIAGFVLHGTRSASHLAQILHPEDLSIAGVARPSDARCFRFEPVRAAKRANCVEVTEDVHASALGDLLVDRTRKEPDKSIGGSRDYDVWVRCRLGYDGEESVVARRGIATSPGDRLEGRRIHGLTGHETTNHTSLERSV